MVAVATTAVAMAEAMLVADADTSADAAPILADRFAAAATHEVEPVTRAAAAAPTAADSMAAVAADTADIDNLRL
jgi:hypothetical protein